MPEIAGFEPMPPRPERKAPSSNYRYRWLPYGDDMRAGNPIGRVAAARQLGGSARPRRRESYDSLGADQLRRTAIVF